MTNATIQAVCFDGMGTLLHPNPSAATIYSRVGRKFGSRLDPAAINIRFAAALSKQEELDRRAEWRCSEARETERWRSIVAEVLDDVAQPESCFQTLYEHFSLPGSWQWADDAFITVRALSQRGYRVCVASNFDRRLHRILAVPLTQIAFEQVFISSEIGWRKPASHFFDSVCRRLFLAPDRVLMVGDDYENDYLAARSVGMMALHLNPLKSHSHSLHRLSHILDHPWLLSS